MTREEIFSWFQRRLNRPAEAFDVYQVAKEFYQLGAYSRALQCLQEYVTMTGAQGAGRHLLAYCLLNLGFADKALLEFKKCAVNDGYHEDWQFIVELILEKEAKQSGKPAIAH